MNYWLMKTEPGAYSYQDLEKLGRDHWDGVRNYQARNNMKEMKEGDLVLIYHSVKDKEVVGVAKVVREFYQDPTTEDERWVVVDIEPLKRVKHPVTLAQIKATSELANMKLVTQSRLSVMPVSKDEYEKIMRISEGPVCWKEALPSS